MFFSLIVKRGDNIKKTYYLFLLIYFFIFLFEIFLFLKVNSLNIICLNFGIKNINIYPDFPVLWHFFKIWYIFSSFFSSIIIIFFIKNCLLSDNKLSLKKEQLNYNSNNLNLLIGLNMNSQEKVFIPEKGLYQNILVTGTIGTGKTSSAMYPFTRQLIQYCCNDSNKKIGMLILDVKGNYYNKVREYSNLFNRSEDVIVIEINGKYKYNPLHKPLLKASVIANQLKSILLLFSPNNTESFWLDKAEQIITEAIKLCRIYNNGYVTFLELHNLINSEEYFSKKINLIRCNFLNNQYSKKNLYSILSSIRFFSKEFYSLDSRTLGILRSEITRITNCFISDYDVMNTFCPPVNQLNFTGFNKIYKFGKIVVLNMNINQYRNLSKIIAAYLKLDFQTEVLSHLSNNNTPPKTTAFISDEYSEYVTALDANFFSQSREAKCINIVSTQSYTSLLNTLNNQNTVKVIVQNLVNKIWFRSDDIFTIEDAQKQLGKIEKELCSRTISENAKNTYFNYFTNSFNSKDSNLSESINKYQQFDYAYDTRFFTQDLEAFSALTFLSDGSKIFPPCVVKMLPYFK